MGRLIVLQSMWAMERRHTDGFERSLEDNVRMIVEAGYGGVSAHCTDRAAVARLASLLKGTGLVIEGQAFPKSVEDLAPVLEIAAEFGVHHVDLQPDVRPRRIDDCLPLLDGWMRLAGEAAVPVWIETHRDRMTTDLYFTLDLLDRRPDLPLIADLSHFLVGREFAWPVSEENHAMIRRVLANAKSFHGRVASREQVQVEISYPHHRQWLDLFLGWWEYGFRRHRAREGADADLCFTCELGPKPYAITGVDGNDAADRWAEALQLRAAVEALHARVAAEPA
ncbi:MAG: sugar phosphate isomerase/epimerase [Hyphomicrobiales bacterium]|nr:sugar phosphate isomerase/epimerase [Hyphomicrobiales bacterium]MDE2016291.1 sugar phosphate isomerase/epimerase [Hyphomicrobiales bacterium]